MLARAAPALSIAAIARRGTARATDRRPARARAAPLAARRAGRRRLVAVLLEVIDERVLELDRASGRALRPRGRHPRARPASDRRTAARACDRSSDSRNSRSRDAGRERDIVRDDDRRDAERLAPARGSSRASTRTRCGSSPTDGSSRNSSLRLLASTRATATRCAWPPDSVVTGVPGSASVALEADALEPRLAARSSLLGVAQRELEVAAHVEMIEQRAALRHEPELRRDRDRAAPRRHRSLHRRARRARTARARTSTCRRPIRRAARRPRLARSRDRCRRSARVRRGARRVTRVRQSTIRGETVADTDAHADALQPKISSKKSEPREQSLSQSADRNELAEALKRVREVGGGAAGGLSTCQLAQGEGYRSRDRAR